MFMGWIKVHRKLKDKGWYKNSNKVHLWIELLLRAAHEKREFMFNGENIELNPGQLITGRKSLAESTGIKESTVERILTFFEKTEHQIEQQKSNRNRLITILTWSEYQSTEHLNGQQADNKRTTGGQQADTNKNKKNLKKGKNDKEVIYPFDDEKFIEAWDLWKKFKKQQFRFTYKPMGEQGALKDIADLSGGNLDKAIAIIHQSIKKGWQGLFDIKGGFVDITNDDINDILSRMEHGK